MKELNLTVGQLLSMYQEAKRLMSKDMPALLAYKISRITKAIEPIVRSFEEQRIKVAKKEGITHEEMLGQLTPLLKEKETLNLPALSLVMFKQMEATPRFFAVFEELIDGGE